MVVRGLYPRGQTLSVARDDPAQILSRFLRDGRLTTIPARRGRRRVILDHLAGLFEPGRTYAEAEVNAVLREFHEDTAALRRYMVEEELLSRREGRYWRSGGTFEID